MCGGYGGGGYGNGDRVSYRRYSGGSVGGMDGNGDVMTVDEVLY